MCINPLRSRGSIASRVSRVLPLCELDYHIFSIFLLIPRVSYVLFINPFRTRVTHVLILWGL